MSDAFFDTDLLIRYVTGDDPGKRAAVRSFHPGTLFALITGAGIFRTEDGGDQWQKMDDGTRSKVVGLSHSTLPGSKNTDWFDATPRPGRISAWTAFEGGDRWAVCSP